MKIKLTIFLLFVFSFSFGQTGIYDQYQKADSLFQKDNYADAYKILKDIEPKCDKKDTLYNYILWYYTMSVTLLENEYRMKEDWKNAFNYGTEALQAIEKGKKFFDEKFAAREYWMYKNVIVSCFGLNDLDKARNYQDILYKAYKGKTLPEGINTYYNFEFFKWDNKNIWGYEWFPELGDPETQGSFSKIVYYVYSTNPDGTDKEQLYRFHVLKFHKIDNSVPFDYVLTKRLETAKNEVSGTLYAYTYVKKIDYIKLRADIREVLKGNYEPDTKTIIKKTNQ